MTETHVVFGAGPTGSRTAVLLADAGHDVLVVTRSGSGPEHPGVRRVAADASDTDVVVRLTAGATAVYNCINPAYTRWDTDWPPVAASLLAGAEASGAVLATVGNLYGFGRVDGPMDQATPDVPVDHRGEVRARMWAQALAAHQAGRARVVEVRASDFADAGEQSHLARNVPALLAGRRVTVMGAADQPHSWTSTHDVARTLVAAAADEDAHGRFWLVPTNPPRSQRQALSDVARTAGVAPPRLVVMGPRVLRAVGALVPMVRELAGTAYQFTAPFVVDDRATREQLGIEPEPWEQVLRRVVEQARAGAAARPARTSAAGRAA